MNKLESRVAMLKALFNEADDNDDKKGGKESNKNNNAKQSNHLTISDLKRIYGAIVNESGESMINTNIKELIRLNDNSTADELLSLIILKTLVTILDKVKNQDNT